MTRIEPGMGAVIMPARVAAMFLQSVDLRSLRARQQTHPLAELEEFLDDLDFTGRNFLAAVANARKTGADRPVVASSLSVDQAALAAGVSTSAIRQAIAEKRLAAQKENGRWVIDPEALETYEPKRRKEMRMTLSTLENVARRLVEAGHEVTRGAVTALPIAGRLALAVGSLAILAEALESISLEDLASMRTALASMTDAEFEAARDGNA